ncbi:CWF19-like protein 2 [Lolium rigidum]|uniref:CWF19-like protein 2 n=1 Tax=Lolium rigidum TaxID=89674 RepID=UPI001F5DE6B9|nr:CWF19-like protein 2 [Lolium rigidum]
MLSGVKLVPRDQILPPKQGGGGDDSGSSDGSAGKRRKKHGRKGRDREEEKRRRRHRRRRSRRSSDDDDSGDGSDSVDEEEEKGLGRSKRRRKHRRDFDDDDESSSESDRGRGRGRGKRRGAASDDEDEDQGEGMGGEGLRASEVVRREMGLDWMLKPASSSQPESSRAPRADNEEEKFEPADDEVKKPNPKEMNPYLRDNGAGYPDESTPSREASQLLASSVVGDGGASWRLKALKRAKEQAAREGRNIEEVVEERWGSLGHLAASVSTSRVAPSYAHLQAIRGRKAGQADNPEKSSKENRKEDKRGEDSGGSREYLRGVSSREHAMRKPKADSTPWKRNRQNMSSEDRTLISSALASINKFSNDGSFMERINSAGSKNTNVSSVEVDEQRDSGPKSHKESSKKPSSVSTQNLNANQLAAKILQLRMKGKNEEADQLSREMETVLENQGASVEEPRHEREKSSNRHTIKPSAADRRKKEEDGDLHLANKIMHNKQYNMIKTIEDEYDYGDAPSKKGKRKNKEAHEEKRSSRGHILTQKERCLYCFENPSRPKHLVVAIGNFTYLMLPQFEPLVLGHCVILPLQHESAVRTVDKNVWEEIRNFKKCLLKMFAQQDKDVVFMETVISLDKQRRHCMIECIPVPFEVSNKAPMYFKKAIDEAEEEWSQHEMKKLIPTSGNLRQVIPENFAYFHVEFGLDRGFVHVIDDETNFSAGFGLNVMRGVLRLPGEDMHRRRRHETMDNQKQAVASFMKDWEPFDWTKQLE